MGLLAADLVSMNETFVKARSIFDRMMEESLARHTGGMLCLVPCSAHAEVSIVYDGRPAYVQNPSQGYIVRPDSRAHQEYMPQTAPQMAPGGPQQYGWNPTLYDQPGYNAYPAAATAYPPGVESHYPGTQPPYGDPNAYAAHAQSPYGQQPPQGYPGPAPAPYCAPPVEQQGYPQAGQRQPPHAGPGPHPGPGAQPGAALQPQSGLGPQPGHGPQPAHAPQPGAGPQPGARPQFGVQVAPDAAHDQPQPTAAPDYYAQAFPQPGSQHDAQQGALPDYDAQWLYKPQPGAQPESQPQAYPGPQVGVQLEPQPQPQSQPQAQQQQQQQPQPQAQTHVEPQPQPESQAQPHQQEPQQAVEQQPAQQQAAAATQQSGPPYVFDSNTTYSDPNVQAWAHYYAHGGTDPTGSVYFISVPGVKEAAPAPVRSMSVDSTTSQDAAAASQTAPLSIHKVQSAEQQQQQQAAVTQSNVYGASPYADANAASGEGAPATGQTYYGLENQFAGMGISGGGPQNGQGPGPQGVGAPA